MLLLLSLYHCVPVRFLSWLIWIWFFDRRNSWKLQVRFLQHNFRFFTFCQRDLIEFHSSFSEIFLFFLLNSIRNLIEFFIIKLINTLGLHFLPDRVSNCSLDLSDDLKVSLTCELFRKVEMNFLEFLFYQDLICQIIDVFEDMSNLMIVWVFRNPFLQKLWGNFVFPRNVFIIRFCEWIEANFQVFIDFRSELSFFFQIV